MRTDDMYPSTFDCALAPIAGAQEDLTLACMMNARQRIAQSHTRSTYVASPTITDDGKEVIPVCAVGAVLAEDGFVRWRAGAADAFDAKPLPTTCGAQMMRIIERQMSQEAREAIALLNEAALELHPEAEDYGTWSGPLEWVNQVWRQDEVEAGKLTKFTHERMVRRTILRIYDRAIAKRQGAPVVA